MSLIVTIFDKNGPISDDFIVVNDDFSEPENFAIRTAEKGQKCFIQWSREEDGMTAYYGPGGVCSNPHWYVKLGRPEEMEGGKRRNVYIDDESWEKALELGRGNASEGIRTALQGR